MVRKLVAGGVSWNGASGDCEAYEGQWHTGVDWFDVSWMDVVWAVEGQWSFSAGRSVLVAHARCGISWTPAPNTRSSRPARIGPILEDGISPGAVPIYQCHPAGG